MQIPLVLGSTSPFRKTLLERLRLDFVTDSPDIDESTKADEKPVDYVQRLSLEKATAIASKHPDSLIISSDQCSVLNDTIRGKPGNHARAVVQLQESSGKRVTFLTGICVFDTRDGTYQLDLVPFHVDFRKLSDREINTYLIQDQPYQCAGSFKSEGLGITLFKRMQGDDPTALIGLPLIRLSEMLRAKGLCLP